MHKVAARAPVLVRNSSFVNRGAAMEMNRRDFVDSKKVLTAAKKSGVAVKDGVVSTAKFVNYWARLPSEERKEKVELKWQETKAAVVHGVKHSWVWLKTGSKLFGANVRVSIQLIKKKMNGFELTRKEHTLLLRTMSDCFKLVPFSFFVIVPFAELLLPFALKLFPQMLPSTFNEAPSDTTSVMSKKLKAKQELAKFFQEMVRERAKQMASSDSAQKDKYEALKTFQDKLSSRSASDPPLLTVQEILPFAKLFREEFKIDNLSLKALQTICRLLGKTPYGFHSHVALQVRHHALRLQREDREILWDGVDSLDHEELVEACKARALKFHGVADDEMRRHLKVWLQLSQHPDIPIVLLLWSRCIALTHMPVQDALPAEQVAKEIAKSAAPTADASTDSASVAAAAAAAEKTAAEKAQAKEEAKAALKAQQEAHEAETKARVAEAEERISQLLAEEKKISDHIKHLKHVAKIGGDVAAANKVEVVSDPSSSSTHATPTSTEEEDPMTTAERFREEVARADSTAAAGIDETLISLSDIQLSAENAAMIAGQIKTKTQMTKLLRRLQAELNLQRQVAAQQQDLLAQAAESAGGVSVFVAKVKKSSHVRITDMLAIAGKEGVTAEQKLASLNGLLAGPTVGQATAELDALVVRVEDLTRELTTGLVKAERLLDQARVLREADTRDTGFYPSDAESDSEDDLAKHVADQRGEHVGSISVSSPPIASTQAADAQTLKRTPEQH